MFLGPGTGTVQFGRHGFGRLRLKIFNYNAFTEIYFRQTTSFIEFSTEADILLGAIYIYIYMYIYITLY